MSNLFVAISDVHVSLKNLDVSKLTLTQALNQARELNVPLVIAGDLNDGKAIMRSEWVKMLIDLFTEYNDVTIEILVGNHDLDNKNSESNSLYFLKILSNVSLWDSASIIIIGGELWGLIPYQTSIENMKKEIQFMKTNDVKRLIIHQGILSAYMGDYVVDESSISPEEFSDFEIVLSGHYHRSQRVGENILYFGSPFTVNFGESNEEKFIWVIEQIEGKINPKPIMTNVRRHVQIELESGFETVIKPVIPEGSLMKIILKGTKEWVRKYDFDFFQKSYPQAASISIVQEVTKQSENRISADIIHSPMKVVDVYLQNCVTDFNKDELKSYLLSHTHEIFSRFTSNTGKSFKIIGVEVENFLSFKHLKYVYTPMGLTLVEGYDEDLGVNTGAGKSTFMDAPVYALFGETSKHLKADEVINRQVGKNLKATIQLHGEDGVYSINRFRKHHEKDNDLFMVLPGGTELRGKDNRETQKLIEENLGCSFDVFLKSSYFTQFGNIDRFLSASDTEKKKLISEITDLSIYDELHEAIKKVVSADEKEIEKVKVQFNQLESNKFTLNNQRIVMNGKALAWEDEHVNEWMLLKDNAESFEHNKKIEIEGLQKKSEQWNEDQNFKVFALKEKAKQYLEQIQEKRMKIQDAIHKNNGDIAGIEFQIEELKAFPIVDVASEKEKIQNKLKIIQQLEIKLSSVQSDVKHKQGEWNKLNIKIELEKLKKRDNQNTECSFCHQLVSGEHIDKHIELMQAEQQPLELALADMDKQILKIKETLCIKSELEVQMKNLDAKDKQQFEVQYKIRQHETSIKNLEQLNLKYQSDLDAPTEDVYGPQISAAEQLVNPYVAQIASVESKVNHYAEQMVKSSEMTNPHLSGVKELQVKVDEMEQQLFQIKEVLNFKDINLKQGQWWKQAIHVYIKSYLMDSCLESINTIANEYLQTLFDGVLKFNITATTEKGSEVKEKIQVVITNNGDECSYESLSGGERCRICLAVNLSLAEVISKSSGKSFNMIFMDEILNGLDEVGKSQSMKLLKELERKYESIFVIDHAEQFKTLFSNSIMVKKKNKVSSLV